MSELSGALRDPEYWGMVKQGLTNALNRGVIGGALGAPVDIANMALGAIGAGTKEPIGGSEWIGKKMQDAGIVNGDRNTIAETLGSFVDPATAGAGVAKLGALASGKLGALGMAGHTAWHGSPKISNELWKAVDTVEHPALTRYSPTNKYISNPNYNSRYANGVDGELKDQIGSLPTKDKYEQILWNQNQDQKIAKQKWEENIQSGIDADARHSAKNRNLDSASSIRDTLIPRATQAQLDSARNDILEVRQNSSNYNPDDIRILERNGQATGAKPWAEDGVLTKETGSEIIDKHLNDLSDKAESLGHTVSRGSSNVSGSRYLTFHNRDGGNDYQLRISNHGDRYPNQLAGIGERFSIDPESGNSIQDAHDWLVSKGIDLSKTPPQKPIQKPLMYGEKASTINKLRTSRGGTPLTQDEIIKNGIIDDISHDNTGAMMPQDASADDFTRHAQAAQARLDALKAKP